MVRTEKAANENDAHPSFLGDSVSIGGFCDTGESVETVNLETTVDRFAMIATNWTKKEFVQPR